MFEYNPSLPNICQVINKHWDLLQLSHKDSISSVHAYKPILAFKRPKNLRDYLVRSSFVDKSHHFSQTCGRRRCCHCKIIIKTGVFTSNCSQESFQMCYLTSCTSQNVIYLIECKRCNMQYIGQTNQKVSKRIDLILIITMIKAMLLMLLFISVQIHSHLTISDLLLSILSIMRWIVFARKLTGFINLTRFIQRAWIRNYCMILSRLADIVCFYYLFLYSNIVHQHWSNSFVLLVCL